MATTTNFGWETPDDTDLVKDGAAAIRTALGGVDTSFVDLKGGTTGQVLSKASNTDLDFTWTADASGIPATILDAKGDLIAATAADTASRLAVGSNGQVLTADSAQATGLKWASPASGMTLIARTDFSSVASQAFDNVFTSTYRTYLVVVEKLFAATVTDDCLIQMRYAGPTTQTASYYEKAAKWNGSWSGLSSGGVDSFSISDVCGSTADYLTSQIYFNGVGNTSEQPNMNFNSNDSYSGQNPVTGAGVLATSRIYTGFLIKSSSSNITGRVAVYGMAV